MNTSSPNTVREKLLSALERLLVTDIKIPTYHWSNDSRRTLREAIEQGEITQEEIRELLMRKLKATAREYFTRNQELKEFPDNALGLAEVFAFGLFHGEFSTMEKAAVRFDHGDTVESFISAYHHPDFIEKVYQQLTTEAPNMPLNYLGGCCHDIC